MGISTYPFVAAAERAMVIQGQYKQVVPGMTLSQVVSVLGSPDEIQALYAAAKRTKQVGQTYWYVIRRVAPHGSVDDKQEVAVRISFDLDGQVTQVDHWGFDEGG